MFSTQRQVLLNVLTMEKSVLLEDYSEEELQTWEYAAMVVFGKYISLCIFILGWITNILAIIVLQTKTYRGTTTGFLLTAVAVADIGSATTTTLHFWIWYHQGIEITSISPIGCRVYTFCMFLSLHVSAWSLTLITIVRTMAVCKPFLVKVVFSRKRTVIAWSSIMVVILALDVNILWIMDIEENGKCNVDIAEFGLGWAVASWATQLILGSAGPFLIMVPCNVVVFIQIIRKTMWRREHATPSNTSAARATGMTSTSVMCLANSVAFIMLTAPHAIYIIYTFTGNSQASHVGTYLQYHIYWILYAMNSCINFFLYSVASRKFRQAFKQLMQSALQKCAVCERFNTLNATGSSSEERLSITQSTTNITSL